MIDLDNFADPNEAVSRTASGGFKSKLGVTRLFASEKDAPTGAPSLPVPTARTQRSQPGSTSRFAAQQSILMSAREERNNTPRKMGWVHPKALVSFRFKGDGSQEEKSAWGLIDNEGHVFSKKMTKQWALSLTVNPPAARTPERDPWVAPGRRVAHWRAQHKSQRQPMCAL